MVRRLRIRAPALFLPSLLQVIFVTVRDRQEAGVWLRWVSVAALLVWGVIRIVRTVPVNSATLDWNPQTPPANWRDLIERTERFHVVAAWAAVVAFPGLLASAFEGR